ncbi:MAG TPA: hypothetical protein VF198_10280 [Vicinamibacterales bacterium]
MLKRFALTGAFAAMCASALIAQSPGQTPGAPGQPTGQTPGIQDQDRDRASDETGMTTVTGCVYREQDVAGLSPNIAERAGVGEDFILADIKAGGSSRSAASSSPLGGLKMVKLEGVDDERLRSFVGQRVEVSGTVSDLEDARQSATPGATETGDEPDLANFEVSSIRQVSGDCPASPGK